MTEIPWRFLLFAAIFGIVVYLHFGPALWQWRKLKGEQDREIDVGYIRRDDYFAQSFRTKVEEWLKAPESTERDHRVIRKGKERIRVVPGSIDLNPEETCDDILVVGGDLSCGLKSRLAREFLVRGNARIQAGCRLQAGAADGSLTLGAGSQVARWLDANGEVTIGRECRVGSRVTSRTRVRLGLSSEVSSAAAPEIATEEWSGDWPAEDPPPQDRLDLTFREDLETMREALEAAQLKKDRIVQLGADTWLYKGDIEFPKPVRLRNKLVVKGNCSIPKESLIEADIRTSGSLVLGPSCWAKGNLVADGDLVVGEGSRFSGNVYAGETLLVRRGARGISPDGLIAAFGQKDLIAEPNVAVKGKMASHGRVVVATEALKKFDWGAS